MSEPQLPPRPVFHLRPPTERDLEIFKRVKVRGHQQWEVAQDYGLHYSRVSQILKKVALWFIIGGSPTDPELRDLAARQRISRATHRLRLNWALPVTRNARLPPLEAASTPAPPGPVACPKTPWFGAVA